MLKNTLLLIVVCTFLSPVITALNKELISDFKQTEISFMIQELIL